MSIVTRAMPAAISLTVVAVVTAILWYLKLTPFSVRDPVFFYVLPIVAVALVYGRGPALLGACAAFLCADYFLYDPLYSLDISTRVEAGDLACFTVLALIGVKCVGELFRPTVKPRNRESDAARISYQNWDAS